MGEMCWDLNPNCMAKAEGDKRQPCPAYEQKIGCWELDWKSMLEKAPKEQKEMMGKWVNESCPKCPVYDKHQAEIDAKIGAIA